MIEKISAASRNQTWDCWISIGSCLTYELPGLPIFFCNNRIFFFFIIIIILRIVPVATSLIGKFGLYSVTTEIFAEPLYLKRGVSRVSV